MKIELLINVVRYPGDIRTLYVELSQLIIDRIARAAKSMFYLFNDGCNKLLVK